MRTVGDNYIQDESVKYLYIRFMVFNATFNNISSQVLQWTR